MEWNCLSEDLENFRYRSHAYGFCNFWWYICSTESCDKTPASEKAQVLWVSIDITIDESFSVSNFVCCTVR